MLPPADLRARVLAEVAREPAPSRREVRVRNAVLFASGFVVPGAVFLLSGGVHTTGRPQALLLATAIGASAIALVALVVAAGRGRSMLGRSGAVLIGLALATPLAMLAWKVAVSWQFPGMMAGWPDRAGFRCLRLSCVLAAWPVIALVMMRRGSDPLHPRLTGAAIGAAAGACSWVFVDLWCPVAYVPHLLIGHVLPIVLTTAAGAWLGKFVALRRR